MPRDHCCLCRSLCPPGKRDQHSAHGTSPATGPFPSLEANTGAATVEKVAISITGIGAATPLGNAYDEIAANLLQGQSGVRKITSFPVDDHPSQIAGVVADIPCPAPFDPKHFASLHRTVQLTLWSC